MTAPTPAPVAAADPAAEPVQAPTLRARLRRGRFAALVVAVVLAGGVVTALAGRTAEDPDLDTTSPAPNGTRALAQLLRSQGVEVVPLGTTKEVLAAATFGTTLVVATPGLLSGEQVRQLEGVPANLVLLAPGERALTLTPGISVAGLDDDEPVAPGACELSEGTRAGDIDGGGLLYTSESEDSTLSCYIRASGSETAAGLVRASTEGRTLTVLGNPGVLINDRLDERGNASLALSLLGQNPRLIWYLPTGEDGPVGGEDTLTSLLPAGVQYGVLMAGIAVLVLALWQGRRLGPVVPESLPVVVRAAETTEGRARLYRRAGARERAAEVVRDGARERLRIAVGLERRYAPAALVDAVAARTKRTPPEVAALLAGPPPADDGALVALVENVHSLEKEVGRP